MPKAKIAGVEVDIPYTDEGMDLAEKLNEPSNEIPTQDARSLRGGGDITAYYAVGGNIGSTGLPTFESKPAQGLPYQEEDMYAEGEAGKVQKEVDRLAKIRDRVPKGGWRWRRLQNKINNLLDVEKRYTKKDITRKSAKEQAKEDTAWSGAKEKAELEGENINELIAMRNNLQKGTAEYAEVQNKINEFYGVSKRHIGETEEIGESEEIPEETDSEEAY